MKNFRYNKVFRNGVIALLFCSLMSAAFIIHSIIFKIQNVSYFYLSIGLIILVFVLVGCVFLMKNRRKFLVTEEEFKIENSKQKNSELMNINGKKIRWQYFNAYIYLMISFMPAVFVVSLGEEFKKGSFDIWNYIVEMTDEIPGILAISSITIGPLIILSILNRFCFGKVLGVIDDSTLFINAYEINLKDIIEITYHPSFILWNNPGSCFATFAVQSKKGGAESFNMAHFPLYGLKEIQKRNPNVKIRFDKTIIFLAICPVISAVFVLLWR